MNTNPSSAAPLEIKPELMSTSMSTSKSTSTIFVLPYQTYSDVIAEKKSRFWQSFGLAFVLELLLVALVVVWIAQHPATAPNEIVPITIENVAEEKTIAPEVPVKPLVAPEKAPSPKEVTPLVRSSPAVPQAVSPPTPAVTETPAVVAPTAFSTPPLAQAPSAPSPVPTATSAPAAPSADYIAKLSAAVQAVLIFPAAARELNFRGRARVEFTLRDSVASHARIITSSGMGMVDRAALQAVQAAAYPPPPAGLQGRDETYQLWVGFNY